MWKVLILLAALSAAQAVERLLPVIGSENAKPIHPRENDERIVNGEEATPGQFPHQVGIWISVEGGLAFCGGSILSEHVIVTAAHCAQPGKSFIVVTGAHEIRKDGVKHNTTKKLVHADYQSDGAVANDIALLYLDEAIELSDRVQPIRLPTAEKTQSYWRSEATVSGWGLQHTHDSDIAPTLRFLNTRVVSNLYCKLRYFWQFIHDSNICVSGWWAKGTCQGDSGGPLVVYEKDGKPTLIGVVSFGIALGCDVSWPPAFTRVSSYLDWIEAGVKTLSAQ